MTAREIREELAAVAEGLDGFASFEDQKRLQARLQALSELPAPPSAADFQQTVARLVSATMGAQELYDERKRETARLIRMAISAPRPGAALVSALRVLEGTAGLPFVTAGGREGL